MSTSTAVQNRGGMSLRARLAELSTLLIVVGHDPPGHSLPTTREACGALRMTGRTMPLWPQSPASNSRGIASSAGYSGTVSGLLYSFDMADSFGVVDIRAGRAWQFADKATAVRYAAGRHAASGNVVEVVRWTDEGNELHLMLPPDAPFASGDVNRPGGSNKPEVPSSNGGLRRRNRCSCWGFGLFDGRVCSHQFG